MILGSIYNLLEDPLALDNKELIMYIFTIPKEPNCEFTASTDESYFTVNLRLFKGITYLALNAISSAYSDDVNEDGGIQYNYNKCAPDSLILPHECNSTIGNLLFTSSDGNYPIYDGFNTKYVLTYLEPEEAVAFYDSLEDRKTILDGIYSNVASFEYRKS